MKNKNQLTTKDQQSNIIYQEHLHQARATFNLTLNLLKVSAIACFASVLLICSGKVPVEKVEAAQGIFNRIVLITLKFTKDANDRLNDENKH